ncbi:hypothetical protein AGMMS49525_11000 [Bacteroidia bacterium]|nr:hypothetical protein AGMMS49525_11000 [Bacteroidia bacterium]
MGDVVGEEYPARIKKIDSVEIGGILRKRITLSLDMVYIEGIGSLEGGLLNGVQSPLPGAKATLVSFSQNGVQVYPKSATGIPQISVSRRK